MPADRANRVTVIVPTRNRRQQLRQALASVRALEGPDLEIELVVVDNGSTDGSPDVAREFGAQVLDNQTPGAAASRNAGLRVASGEFVAFLDDDDVFLPGHLRPHIALMRARPELAAVVGQIVLTDSHLNQPSDPYPLTLPEHGELFMPFLGQYFPQVGATLARTTVRETVGDFDPDMEGDEDWDWHLRLALAHKVGFVPVPCMFFRMRPPGTNADIRWIRLRNTRRVFWTNALRAKGSNRPGVLATARMFLHHNGQYAGHFVADARREAQMGHMRQALIEWTRAMLASPPHALLGILTARHA